ncbi:hypothetical protein FPZ54_03400 [Sphingomonas suaedae]|uniref:Transcriptional regulator-like domain-containing protein n=1 Tax=Sphingomonas suaedae TaxID=2599297 RepID=A0A518RCL3_9SPHN|nr:DUF6499 domain-containing protein [Sphingomonas suaedae]QDX25164.1 hypothetical protein FPZ54_03400 [Sphingomonas suaedae]
MRDQIHFGCSWDATCPAWTRQVRRSASAAGDWRDCRRYRRLLGIDRAGLMWEWLRRDPDYIAWYARASAVTRGSGDDGNCDAATWGLHFRRRP